MLQNSKKSAKSGKLARRRRKTRVNKRRTVREWHKLRRKPKHSKASRDSQVNIQAKVKGTRMDVHHCLPSDTRLPKVQPKVNTANKEAWSTPRMVATCTTSKATLIPHTVNKPTSSVSKRHTPTLQQRLT